MEIRLRRTLLDRSAARGRVDTDYYHVFAIRTFIRHFESKGIFLVSSFTGSNYFFTDGGIVRVGEAQFC